MAALEFSISWAGYLLKRSRELLRGQGKISDWPKEIRELEKKVFSVQKRFFWGFFLLQQFFLQCPLTEKNLLFQKFFWKQFWI